MVSKTKPSVTSSTAAYSSSLNKDINMLGFRNLSGILTIITLVISTFFVSHAEANSVAFSKTSLDVGSYKYALVGDKIPLGVSVVPKTGGNFSYSVRIDEKSSTSSWRQMCW
jgi:hypothetical protein